MRDHFITTSHFSFVSIKRLEISRTVNQHGIARIEGNIRDSDAEVYRAMLTKDVWLNISAKDGEGNTATLFWGIVTDFSLHNTVGNYELAVTVTTGTYLMDVLPHFRTYQNPEQSYDDIMREMNRSYHKADVSSNMLAKEPIEEFYLQNNETDWEFIKRLSSKCGNYIVPSIQREGVIYFCGSPSTIIANHLTPKVILDESRQYEVRKNLADYWKKREGGMSLLESDAISIIFSDRDIYDLLDPVQVEHQKYLITEIHSQYQGEQMIHTYTLQTPHGVQVLRQYNECHAGCSFLATITDIRRNEVQILVHGDENANQKVRRWFLFATIYSSPEGAGWYFMPEKGDTVRLHIPQMSESGAYVISAVHMEGAQHRQDPDIKSLKTIHGKEVRFTPDSIVITNNNGMSISLVDQQGISIVSDKNITIAAVENLWVSSDNGAIVVAGQDAVKINQGGSSVTVKDDIIYTGGKMRMQ